MTAEKKREITGWVSLFTLIVMFSGLLKNHPTLRALDFSYLLGTFGKISEGADFAGKGGIGTRQGFLVALTLVPSLMLSSGLIAVAQELGALEAAAKFFKPILGIPGVAGLDFVSSFTSSDIGAVMTKELYDDKYITDEERAIFVSYQYAASAVVTNTISAGGPLLSISLLPLGGIILIQLVVKIMGANIIRFMIYKNRNKVTEGEVQYG